MNQRDLIARLRQEARNAGQAAPGELAERIVATLPRRRAITLPRLSLAMAAAATLMAGILWSRLPVAEPAVAPPVAEAPTPLPAPTIDPGAMPDMFTEPEHPLNGELAALRRDGQRLVDFFSAVGEPLRSAANLGADQARAQ